MVIARRFAAVISIVLVLFLSGCVVDSPKQSNRSSASTDAVNATETKNALQTAPGDSLKDLVCGMTLELKSPAIEKIAYKGTTYYFCSESCKKMFEENPEKYVHKAAESGQASTKAKE
jgi:YHS domain-containing protein